MYFSDGGESERTNYKKYHFGTLSLICFGLFLALLLIIITSCASTVNLSTTGTRNYHALQLVRTLGLMQDTAIDAGNAGVLTKDKVTDVILFVKAAVTAEKAQKAGWLDGINSSLNSLESTLGPNSATFNLYITSIRSELSAIVDLGDK